MDYKLIFNHLSLPASTVDTAYDLLFDVFQGVLNLYQQDERFSLYAEHDNLELQELSTGFTYGDFKERLLTQNENDLRLFIDEIEDKSPYLYNISQQDVDKLGELWPYFKDKPLTESLEVFSLAWLLDGIMLSLATTQQWLNHKIAFFIREEGRHKDIAYEVYNIAQKDHANLILKAQEVTLQEICEEALFTENFITWYQQCKPEDRTKIRNKLQHCYENKFQLGRPLIDTLKGSEFTNMKEIRAGTEHAGRGQIRIFFAMNLEQKPCILLGFIKHNNHYEPYITLADKLFNPLNSPSL